MKGQEKKNGNAIMRKIARLLFVSICGYIMTNCIYDDIDSIETGGFCIYANREAPKSTKTELQDDNSIVWTEGDAISLFAAERLKTGLKLVSTHTGKTTGTIFKGKDIPNESGPYWAVYPYEKNAMCDGHSITTILPSKQIAKIGSFADRLFISVANSESNVMTFYNVCGGIKFSVKHEGISELFLTNNDGGSIAGTLNITMDSNGLPKINSITDGKSQIRVSAPAGETFSVGETYYIVIPPLTFSEGITIRFITNDGKEGIKVIQSSSTIERSVFSRLLNIDEDVEFSNCPYIVFFADEEDEPLVTIGYSPLFSNSYIEYSHDGEHWYKHEREYNSYRLSEKSPLFLRGYNNTALRYPIHFRTVGYVACYGDIMSLVDYKKNSDVSIAPTGVLTGAFKGCTGLTHAPALTATTLETDSYKEMFSGCTSLVTAPALPATNLNLGCYWNMFEGCTSLTVAPELPASGSYDRMFKGCTSLTVAPELPASEYGSCRSMFEGCTSLTVAPELPYTCGGDYTSMFEGCTSLTTAPTKLPTKEAGSCWKMFKGCTSLTTAPALPATVLKSSCYREMFEGCTSLTMAPELPATVLDRMCYEDMFNGCTSLITVPELPATTLAEACYMGMFSGCTSLTVVPELPATTLAEQCYQKMFYECESLTVAPALPATTLPSLCYCEMFCGCKSLTTAPQLPAKTLSRACYCEMFCGCKSLTTAPQLPAKTLAESCYSNMFGGCESLTAAPQLPAKTLAESCYSRMFQYCTSLTTAPQLPATTLAESCYSYMFSDCSSLTTAPSQLPATTMAESCCSRMFQYCTSLTTAPQLPATTLAKSCYSDMFRGCESLTTAPSELPATTLAESCYSSMFSGCCNLAIVPELPAVTLPVRCYEYMFRGCRKLNYVKALFTTIDSYSLNSWLEGVASYGVFVKSNVSSLTRDEMEIPSGWTIKE